MKHRRAVLGSLSFGLLVSFGAWAIGTAERPCKVVGQDSAASCGSRSDLVDRAFSGGGPNSSPEPSRTFEPGGSEPSHVVVDGIADGAAEVPAPERSLLA